MTSRYHGRSDAPTITRRRHVLACARCRARRVKCDRGQPACSNCIKVGAACQPVQHTASSHAPTASRPGSREPMEQSRLLKLEEKVARLSRDVDSRSPSREPSESPSPGPTTESHSNFNQTGVIRGQSSTYLSPYSWAATAEEVLGTGSILGDVIPDISAPSPRDLAGEVGFPVVDDRLHETLLGVFSHRVHPLVHILHWPSFLDNCRSFRQKRSSYAQTSGAQNFPHHYATGADFGSSSATPTILPSHRGMQGGPGPLTTAESNFATLLNSVYFASLASIVTSPNPPDLGANVNALALWSTLRRQITVKISTLSGSSARPDSLEMLQAIVIYTSLELGASDPQLQWLQLGTAIRMAQALGVHRDPSIFDFDPVQTETRRRTWAQISILDTRLAEHLCREPTITPDSYDTILPLSIGDHDLAEMTIQGSTMRRERETVFGSLQEVEQAQEHNSPFSSVTFMLIEAEMARQQQQLSCPRYQPRDRPSGSSSGSPRFKRRATPSGSSVDEASWVGELHNRYLSKYSWDRLDTSDGFQHLVSEICQINLMKARFISRLTQPQGDCGSGRADQVDTISIFHDALQLATRCAAISHQYSTSPFDWYTRKIREPYSCGFLAFVLASDQYMGQEDTNAAWAVLDQLFAANTGEPSTNAGSRIGLLGKVLAKATAKRGLQVHVPITPQYRPQSMQGATAGGYPMHMAQLPPVSSAATLGQVSSFQTSGNIFEDWDALMPESMWPGGVSGPDNYWSNRLAPPSAQHSVYRSQSHPYEQHAYQRQALPTPPAIQTTFVLDPHTHPRTSTPLITPIEPDSTDPRLSPLVSDAAKHWAHSPSSYAGSPIYLQEASGGFPRSGQLSSTWTLPSQARQLHGPRRHRRGRSTSQPPYVAHLRTPSASEDKRGNASPRPTHLQDAS